MSAEIKTASSSMSLPVLDGLRGLAVLLTVVYHYFVHLLRNHSISLPTREILGSTLPIWDFGATGVHLFFVLSGFLLILPYARAVFGIQKWQSPFAFYWRRIRRIAPAYWVSLILLIFLQPDVWNDRLLVNTILHTFFLHNWDQELYTSINVPYWTLAVESQYYLLLPLWVWILASFVRSSRSSPRASLTRGFLFILSSFMVSPFYIIVLIQWIKPIFPVLADHASLMETIAYFNIFVVGMAIGGLYIFVTEVDPRAIDMQRLGRFAGILGIAVLAAHRLWVISGHTANLAYWSLNYTFLGLGYGGILLGALYGWDRWKRFFTSHLMRFLGLISYSLYLWNWFMYKQVITPLAIEFAGHAPLQIFDASAFVFSALFTLILLVPLAYLSYRLFEKPFLTARA